MADELWSVRLPTGVIRRGTLDELDAAFDAGHIDENVLVLAPNGTEWQRLGALAGLDEGAPPAPPAASYAPPQQHAAPNSIRPMTTDLDDHAFDRPRSRAPLVIGLVAVAAVAAATIFAITKVGGGAAETLPVAAAVAAPPAAPPAPVVEPQAAPPSRLTEEQKQTVLDNDAKRSKTQSEKKKARDAAAAAQAAKYRYHRPASVEYGPSKPGAPCGCHHGDPLCTCN
jgi:hypothetical protein